MTLLDPRIWLVFLALFFGTGVVSYEKGKSNQRKVDVAEATKERLVAEQKARAIEQELTQKVADLGDQLSKEKASEDDLRKRVASGAVRVRVLVHKCTPVQPAASAAAPGDRDEARADLDPAIAQFIVGLTNEGDAAIRQLNACIDTYNAARAKLNLTKELK